MSFTEKYKLPPTHGRHLPGESVLQQEQVRGRCDRPGLARLPHGSLRPIALSEMEWTTEYPNKPYLFEVTECIVPLPLHYVLRHV
jgi:hypothetical protein